MTSLKRKILTILISMVSIFIFVLLILYNISIYNSEYNNTIDKMHLFDNINKSINNTYNPALIDTEAYEVILNRYGEVEEIISYTENGLSKDEILKLVKKKINNNNQNLYLNKYILSINHDGNIIIIDNETTQKHLIANLIKSLIIVIIAEIILIISSLKITKWIVDPVIETIDKQKQFIADASHELKTPLAIITASAETLEQNPKELKWISNIKSETSRMNDLVTNLLKLSKSENIREMETFEIVNLSKLIENKTLSFESLIYEKELKLEYNITENINFNCNKERIKELLSILIDNAIKHSYSKEKIGVNLYRQKNDIILSVTNKGKEIPLDEQEKIFERFYRASKSRNRGENRYGLGLSIAKNIVINHNGMIKVKCRDSYTTFIVIFKEK